jgi:hypothetical protein
MRSALYAWLFCLCLLPFPVWAQQTAATSAQGAVLLQRSLGALVGATPVADVTLTGVGRRISGPDDESGAVTLKAMVGGAAKIEMNLPSGAHSEVRAESPNGPAGNWAGPNGVLHEHSQHNCWTDAAWFFPAFLSAYGGSQDVQVSYVGPESRDGASVVHLRFTKLVPGNSARNASSFVAQLSQTEVYLDPQSLLPVAIAFNIHPDNNASSDIPVEVRYSDYRSVNANRVPFHVQEYIQHGLSLDLAITSVIFNSGLNSSEFPIQ